MAEPLPKHRAREYETIFIASPEASPGNLDQITGRLVDTIGRLDGKLLRAENWGKRRLAYPVRKHAKGYYYYLRYLGYSDLVHEIERNLRMLEQVIKYLTVKIDEDVNPEARPVREEDISFQPQFVEEPDRESDETDWPTKHDEGDGAMDDDDDTSSFDDGDDDIPDDKSEPSDQSDDDNDADDTEE